MNIAARTPLGRGLAALIPSAEHLERREYTPAERLLDQLVNAGFDLLQEGNNLGLCAYLHARLDGEPMLFLRTPTLDMLTPTRAFRFMHSMAMLTNLESEEGAFEWEGTSARYVRSRGRDSDGLHIVARARGRFDHGSLAIVREICRAFGRVAHQVESGDRDDGPAVRLVVSSDAERCLVEAIVADGSVSHVGRGRSNDPLRAVARAVIDAIAEGYHLVDARVLAIEEIRAVLVVVTDPEGSLRLGLAVDGGDANYTAARAAMRAISDL